MHFSRLATILFTLFCAGCARQDRCTELDRYHASIREKKIFHAIEETIPSELDLEQIIDIALRQNLDLFVKELECAIQREVATGAKFEMLPELLLNAETNARNNNPGSSSQSLDPGVPPAPPSVSSEKKTSRWDAGLTWNLLDFGISYFKARQETNAILVKRFEYEKMRQNLILDITQQYWTAVAALEAIEKLRNLIDQLKSTEIALRNAASSQLVSESRVILSEEQVLENTFKIHDHQRTYHFAVTEIKRLMGSPPSAEFTLIYPKIPPAPTQLPRIHDLEEIALLRRPELYSKDIEERIQIDEVRVSVLQYLPGISLFNIYNFDSNKFLLNNYWNLAGIRAIWDLLSIPAGMKREEVAIKNVSHVRRARLALSLAAVAQVNLAYLVCLEEQQRYQLTQKIADVKLQKLQHAKLKEQVGMFDIEEVLEYETGYVDANIRSWQAYSDLRFALEQLNNAIGIPRYLFPHSYDEGFAKQEIKKEGRV